MNKASEPKQAKLATVKVGNYVQYTLRALRKCETVGELDMRSKLRGFVLDVYPNVYGQPMARIMWATRNIGVVAAEKLKRCPRDTTERAVDLDARPSER
jgi:hypothetical protein